MAIKSKNGIPVLMKKDSLVGPFCPFGPLSPLPNHPRTWYDQVRQRRRPAGEERIWSIMAINLYNTLTRQKEPLVTREHGQSGDVCLWTDALRLSAHRQRAHLRRLRHHPPLPGIQRIRRHLRAEFHRHRRQDHQTRQRAGDLHHRTGRTLHHGLFRGDGSR